MPAAAAPALASLVLTAVGVLVTVGGLAAFGGLAGCTRDSDPPLPKPAVRLHATITATGSSLAIDYQVVNTDGVPVVLFTGLPGKDTPNRPEVDPDAVYVSASGDTVEVAKRLFEPPEGAELAAYYAIRGVVVAPGATFAERVEVPLPLRAHTPYDFVMKHPPTLPKSVHKVRFCLGAAREDQTHPVVADSPDTDPDPVFQHGFGIDRAQRVACSQTFRE